MANKTKKNRPQYVKFADYQNHTKRGNNIWSIKCFQDFTSTDSSCYNTRSHKQRDRLL